MRGVGQKEMLLAAVCRRVGMSRANYYARCKTRQRERVAEGLVVALVQAQRQLQPPLTTAGVKLQ